VRERGEDRGREETSGYATAFPLSLLYPFPSHTVIPSSRTVERRVGVSDPGPRDVWRPRCRSKI